MNKQKFSSIIAWPLSVVISKFIKYMFVVGTYSLKISGITITLPLMGALFPLSHVTIFMAILLIFKNVVWHLPLTFGLPTMAATFSWACANHKQESAWEAFDFFLHCVIPLGCCLLFVTHPVGRHAICYSFYWFIPPLLWLISSSSIFFRALKSTFVAHAIGSIIWLFANIFSAEQWIGLIPVVAVERLGLALASCGLYYFLARVYSPAYTFNISIRN